MTSKRKAAKQHDSNQISAAGKSKEEQAALIARNVLRPTVQAAFTFKEYGKSYGDLDLAALINALVDQSLAIIEGDLTRAESMLTAQAHTLDAIFNNLAERAINSGHTDHLNCFLKLALRAQAQSRATWEALSNIKNPPMMGYVRQANIAHGPQQVNNASDEGPESPRARKNPKLQNKLMEDRNGKRLDTGKTGPTGRTDSAMETVGEIDRTKVRRR